MTFQIRNPDWTHRVNIGSSPAERWYPLNGISGATAMGTTAPSTGFLYAIPFLVPVNRMIDRLAVYITTLSGNASSRTLVGLYSNKSDKVLYPDKRLEVSSEIDSSTTGGATGYNGITSDISLVGGNLYWGVFVCGTAAPTIKTFPGQNAYAIYGTTATASQIDTIWGVSRAYDSTLPATFPTGGFAFGSTNTQSGMFARYK